MQRARQAMFSGGSRGGAQLSDAPASSADLPKGASLNAATLPTDVVFKYDASVADVTTQQIQPILAITQTTYPEFLLTANNAPGIFWDLKNSWLVLDWSVTAAGANQYNVPHTIGNSMMLFKDWQVMINDVNCSEQNNGLDQYTSWAKASLLYPQRDQMIMNSFPGTGSTVYYGSATSVFDQDTQDGIVTPSYIRAPAGTPAGCPASYTDLAYTEPTYLLSSQTNHRYTTRVFVPHPLFQQDRYVPASFNVRLRMTAIDPSYDYAVSQATGDNPTITINSLTWYVPRVTLTAAGLSVYRSLLAEHGMAVRYACLRTQLQTFSMPAGQTSFDFAMLSRRRPTALCFHVVDTTRLLPTTIGQSAHPFEQNFSDPFRLSTLRIQCGGEQFPKYSNYAITRGTYGWSTSGGTSVLDTNAYQQLCLQYRDSDKYVQPLIDLNLLAQSGQMWMCYVDLTSNQQGVIDRKSPLELIGNIDINIMLQSALAVNKTLLLTAFYNDVLTLEPGTGTVTPGW